jgi:lipoic acid synthetase
MEKRLPPWFKQPHPGPGVMERMEGLLDGLRLHTICESAHCPNAGDCFSRNTATFLILGDTCTRNCTFCAVTKGRPLPPDAQEPEHLLEAVATLGLRYVVITSVTRDDLDDGGAAHFARTIELIHQQRPGTRVEVLIPDFQGSRTALQIVVNAHPEVINHNVETVPRLYPQVRPRADYRRSVQLLATVKEMDTTVVTKSGLMVGLGETEDEVVGVMRDLRAARCNLLTIGQYLPPSGEHYPLVRYVTPEEFSRLADIGRELGFAEVASAPLVRSSYKAAELYLRASGPVN